MRQAKLYIFAVLYHIDKATLNPLDLDQWHFYLLPTKILNERTRSQHSITLKSLEALSTFTRYRDLRSEVEKMELSISVMTALEDRTLWKGQQPMTAEAWPSEQMNSRNT